MAHGSHGKLLVGKLCFRVFLKAEIDRPVDFLPYLAHEPLSRRTGSRRELVLWHAPLFQALPELGLPAAFLLISLLPLTQLPVEGAVVLTIRGRDEIRNAHINADDGRIGRSLDGYLFIVRKRQPPRPVPFVERHTAVDRAALFRFWGL